MNHGEANNEIQLPMLVWAAQHRSGENALLELSKRREFVHDLAPLLWHSCGTISVLVQDAWIILDGLIQTGTVSSLLKWLNPEVIGDFPIEKHRLRMVSSHF